MSRDRDVEAFHERAATYETGRRGRIHHDIVDRTLELALGCHARPRRVLDVGCGTGRLLQRLADRDPEVDLLVGIDAARGMVTVAHATARTGRVTFTMGVAEALPYADASFDLVLSSTSFDHWTDQLAGLRECARVMAPTGHLVLVDLFSRWLAPTLLAGRHGRARTRSRAEALLRAAGFRAITWHPLYSPIIAATIAST